MTKLTTTTNLTNPDAVYTAIIDAHRDLTDEQSAAFNARMVLLLANHIGDDDIVLEALNAAQD